MKGGIEMSKPLTLRRASDTLGLTYYTLLQGIHDGRFPHVLAGNRYLVYPEQITEVLAAEAVANQQARRQAAQAQRGA